MKHAIFASYGNDSIALIQWAREYGLNDVTIVYNDTGWAADWWPQRVALAEQWAQSLGFSTHRTQSEGMAGLLERKSAWPRGGGGKYQFCTEALKIKPTLDWLSAVDPKLEVTCINGLRREESSNRANAPEYVEESEGHGGRSLWSPLVRHTTVERDALILKSPFEVLPHRSKECYPCVNAQKHERAALPEERIALIESMEADAGINSKGNPRVMFSPDRNGGAVGIRAVVKWAQRGTMDDMFADQCSSGYCG